MSLARIWNVDIVPFHDLSPVDGLQASRDLVRLRPGSPYEIDPLDFFDDDDDDPPPTSAVPNNVFAAPAGTAPSTPTARPPSAAFTSPTREPSAQQEQQQQQGQQQAGYYYPEDSATPLEPPRGYFNYDQSETAQYGPGHPVMEYSSDGFQVVYANNMWSSPSSQGGGGNWQAPYEDYEWDEFGSTGWGPWVNTLADRQLRINNQCKDGEQQSPIDVRLSGVACVEHHQIRTLVSSIAIQ